MALLIGGPDVRNAAMMTLFLAWRHQQNFRNLFTGGGGEAPEPNE
jgi:hypothetical protein